MLFLSPIYLFVRKQSFNKRRMYQFDIMRAFTKEQFHRNGEHIERTKNMESPCKYCECNYCSHEACRSEKCGECSPEKHKNTGCLKSMYRATLSSADQQES